jgi:long-chain acyl-CoA synthetase
MDSAPDTFPKLLVRNAEQHPERVALREKKLGVWQTTTWREYRDVVRDFSLGLINLGLARGDKVAILGDNRPQWLMG